MKDQLAGVLRRTAGVLACLVSCSNTGAQEARPGPAAPSGFKWVNAVPADLPAAPALGHRTFHSQANQTDVGYFIVLPRGYEAVGAERSRFPVIYYLHGGVQGGESRGARGSAPLWPMLTAANYPPVFLVVVNGGQLNYYDTADSKGETAFRELVAHVDQTFRTLADRRSRVLVGHSMGGRAVGRFVFKFPELFGTGVALSGGHQREKQVSETGNEGKGGAEIGDRANNTFDLASTYVKSAARPPVRLMVVVGNQDGNYPANLEWCMHLSRLRIVHDLVVVPGAGHGLDWKIKDTDRRIFDFIAEGVLRTSGN